MATVIDRVAGGGGVSIPVSLTTATSATTTDGILLGTTATASAGNQKFSPALHFQGSGWKTNATAAAQSVDWKAEVQPVQGSANPWGELVFSGAINGGTYKKLMSLRHGFQTGSGEDDTWAEFRIGNMTDNKPGQLIFTSTTDRLKLTVSSMSVESDFTYSWSNSNTSYATADTGLSRAAAGVVGVGNGTAADFSGTLKLTTLFKAPLTVATLPAGPTRGWCCLVSDASSPTFLATVASGGTVVTPVFYDGAAWRVG